MIDKPTVRKKRQESAFSRVQQDERDEVFDTVLQLLREQAEKLDTVLIVKDSVLVLTTKFDQFVVVNADRQAEMVTLRRDLDDINKWRYAMSGSIATLKYLVGSGVGVSIVGIAISIWLALHH